MNSVLAARAGGPVAFVGEGRSDRFAALYADVVFAKDVLVDVARTDGVPFLPWDTFDDVRETLETLDVMPGPVGGERCPGWRLP
jgi:2-hydroxy-3-keto-5-methylthiopentenyl-1-phosphate phosphatase